MTSWVVRRESPDGNGADMISDNANFATFVAQKSLSLMLVVELRHVRMWRTVKNRGDW